MLSDRLKQIIDYKGISSRAFAIKIGSSSQSFGKYLQDREPSASVLSSIVETFSDINAAWLLTGEGEMLKKNNPVAIDVSNMVSMPADVWEVIKNQAESLKSKDAQTSEVIEMLKEQMKKSYRVEKPFRAASSMVVMEDE